MTGGVPPSSGEGCDRFRKSTGEKRAVAFGPELHTTMLKHQRPILATAVDTMGSG